MLRQSSSDQELLAWVNASLPSSTPLASDLSDSLRSGRLLVRLVENLSGKSSNIADSEFEKYQPPATKDQPFDPEYFDTVFNGELFLLLQTNQKPSLLSAFVSLCSL